MEWRINWCIIFYLRYSRLFWIYLKKTRRKNCNPSIRPYTNKTENRITFEIKTGYYLKLLTPEIMTLFGDTKRKITKDENGGIVPHLETT